MWLPGDELQNRLELINNDVIQNFSDGSTCNKVFILLKFLGT